MKILASVAAVTGFLAFGAAQAGPVVHPIQKSAISRSGNTFHMGACPTAASGAVGCHARIVTNSTGVPVRVGSAPAKAIPHTLFFPCQATSPAYCIGEDQLRAAYNITGMGKTTTTVAIVDAFAYPGAEAGLAAYRATWGLPACSVASGCLTIMNEAGGTTVTAPVDEGWDEEQALDLDMVSAMCPNCKILLVQANTNSFADLGISVNTAAKQPGVHAISNSYGSFYAFGNGELGSQSFEWYYNHPGIAVTVSTGDYGYGVGFPADSPHVTAAGGTSLYMNGYTRTGEAAWAGAGSGCSTAYLAPAWQTPSHANMANNTLCTMRVQADVSAVADPNTGVLVYLNIYDPSNGLTPGFYIFGGTSVASPLIAGIYGERDDAVYYGRNPYLAPSWALNNVTTGTNSPGIFGLSCGGTYLCVSQPGYSGPTGLGTPNGDTAF